MPHERRVFIIGGGLAGMATAHALAKQGIPAVILEASNRLGGKAGADFDSDLGLWLDHGFHIFPLWYANVRGLLAELGLFDRLIDTDTQFTITRAAGPGAPGQWYQNYAVTSLRRLLHNLRASPLQWHESLLATYFLLDLAAEPLNHRSYLDRVSVNGFFRSRFYRTEAVANFHHFLGLQASSIPGDAMSAKTFQRVAHGFMQYRSALVGILRGDLQTEFIAPFERQLTTLGVHIHLGHPVDGFEFGPAGVSGLRTATPLPGEQPSANDLYVLATPPEIATRFVTDELYAREHDGHEDIKPLAGLQHLVSEPMAALHVVFKRRLPHIPPWHTGLHQSRYGLSFIDISQHWSTLAGHDQTILSVIAANFKELRSLSEPEAQAHILKELLDYLRYDRHGTRVIDDGDVLAVRLNPNVRAPLFLNTTSAWHFRPDGRTRVPNLFVAGDYCRSHADLTSMESAVWAGQRAAQHILKLERNDPGPAEPQRFAEPPRWQLVGLKWGLLPIVAGAALCNRLTTSAPRSSPDGAD